MRNIIVLDSTRKTNLEISGAEVISAREYLTDRQYGQIRNIRIYNLCRSFSYQSLGYYVSLLAAARGHKPLPSISTIVDIRNVSLVRFVSDDLDELIQKSLKNIQSNPFTLSIYFGKNLAVRHDKLSKAIWSVFPAPFIEASFRWADSWQLSRIRAMSFGDVPEEHREFALQRMQDFFEKRTTRNTVKKTPRYNMAILYNPTDVTTPSDPKAIERFKSAAEDKDISVEVIEKGDYGRLAEFDALFIRETTAVNHHTFRFARKAQAEGIVVIDDADSILKCTNKVFLAELLERFELPAPRTYILHERNRSSVLQELGLPMILKKPDSSFSLGVVKVESPEAFHEKVDALLEESDLVIAQEFLPTDFDWRIGVLGNEALFACKYFMARHHWQIAKHSEKSGSRYGRVEAMPLDMVPSKIISTAVKAASAIGDGLYGVDMKQVGNKGYVIEVNENPNIDAGIEDGILKEQLYQAVINHFLVRLEKRTHGTI